MAFPDLVRCVGIVLQPDVRAAFRFAGVPHDGAVGVRSDDRIYLDANDEVIHRAYMPQPPGSWNMLYAAMRSVMPGDDVHAGEQLAWPRCAARR